MTPTRGQIARIIIAAACAATVGTAMAVPGAERWIALPSQPDSIASLDAGSVQRMPSGPVSAWVRVEARNPRGLRALRQMFGAVRGDMADFLYTIDCRSRQFTVSRAKLYQGALTVSETRFGNDAGWQRVDGVGLAAAVAHELCAG